MKNIMVVVKLIDILDINILKINEDIIIIMKI